MKVFTVRIRYKAPNAPVRAAGIAAPISTGRIHESRRAAVNGSPPCTSRHLRPISGARNVGRVLNLALILTIAIKRSFAI